MSSVQNDRNIFPLNRELLTIYARRWVDKIPEAKIFKITLYRYASHFAKILQKQHPVKYCIVFDIDNEILPKDDLKTLAADHIDKILSGDRSIYNILECFHTIYNQDSYLFLMDAGFSDVYHSKPDKNFKDEWMFLTRRLAEGNHCIMSEEPCWVLYDAANTTDMSIPSESSSEAGRNRPNVRKAVVLEVARSVKKNFPTLTRKKAALEINARLDKEYNLEGYSCKYLEKIIKHLNFKQGKAGRPPEK